MVRWPGELPVARLMPSEPMLPPDDHLPAPPDLPSFTVGDVAVPTPLPARRRADREERDDGRDRYAGTNLVRHDVVFDEDRIDPDAAKVVRRLDRAGFEAY